MVLHHHGAHGSTAGTLVLQALDLTNGHLYTTEVPVTHPDWHDPEVYLLVDARSQRPVVAYKTTGDGGAVLNLVLYGKQAEQMAARAIKWPTGALPLGVVDGVLYYAARRGGHLQVVDIPLTSSQISKVVALILLEKLSAHRAPPSQFLRVVALILLEKPDFEKVRNRLYGQVVALILLEKPGDIFARLLVGAMGIGPFMDGRQGNPRVEMTGESLYIVLPSEPCLVAALV